MIKISQNENYQAIHINPKESIHKKNECFKLPNISVLKNYDLKKIEKSFISLREPAQKLLLSTKTKLSTSNQKTKSLYKQLIYFIQSHRHIKSESSKLDLKYLQDRGFKNIASIINNLKNKYVSPKEKEMLAFFIANYLKNESTDLTENPRQFIQAIDDLIIDLKFRFDHFNNNGLRSNSFKKLFDTLESFFKSRPNMEHTVSIFSLSRSETFKRILDRCAHPTIKEVENLYFNYGLYERKNYSTSVVNSVRSVMENALHSRKRLFLHKLRNNLTTTPNGLAQFNPNLKNLSPNSPSKNSKSYQVQRLYTHSKPDRSEGHYKPLNHDLLSNFAWLYAGIKNGDLSKSGEPKSVNLILANPSNRPENSKIDPDKLYRKGNKENGLSALGYELAFLQVAGFKVDSVKLDQSSGLTKIKLMPPENGIDSFENILKKAAAGFLQKDYRNPANRAIDVNQFLTQAKSDPNGWGKLLENI